MRFNTSSPVATVVPLVICATAYSGALNLLAMPSPMAAASAGSADSAIAGVVTAGSSYSLPLPTPAATNGCSLPPLVALCAAAKRSISFSVGWPPGALVGRYIAWRGSCRWYSPVRARCSAKNAGRCEGSSGASPALTFDGCRGSAGWYCPVCAYVLANFACCAFSACNQRLPTTEPSPTPAMPAMAGTLSPPTMSGVAPGSPDPDVGPGTSPGFGVGPPGTSVGGTLPGTSVGGCVPPSNCSLRVRSSASASSCLRASLLSGWRGSSSWKVPFSLRWWSKNAAVFRLCSRATRLLCSWLATILSKSLPACLRPSLVRVPSSLT